MNVLFDALQSLATFATYIMAILGWTMVAAAIAFSQQRATKKVWQYGIVGFVVGAIVAGVSYW